MVFIFPITTFKFDLLLTKQIKLTDAHRKVFPSHILGRFHFSLVTSVQLKTLFSYLILISEFSARPLLSLTKSVQAVAGEGWGSGEYSAP